VWTRPLRKLTPRTSYGYAVIHFAAAVLHQPLDPWQQWLVIHLGEMLPDGRPRFRQVLVIVARQNGKTHLCKVLALFWLFIERHPLVFGTSTNLEQAKEAWEAAVQLAEDTPELVALMPRFPRHKRIGNGQQVVSTVERCRYKIGAADSRGGRGKSIDRAIGDELREQHSWDAYSAAYNAMNARRRAQVVYITNMGDARSIVLNSLRQDALDEMDGVERPIALFEWSAAPGSHVMDPAAHAAANPQWGRRMDPDVTMSAARRVAKPGADPIKVAEFMTEILCITVKQLDPAIDPNGWAAGADPAPIDLEQKGRLAACVDVSPDQQHASLVVATALDGGRVRIEAVESWDGVDAVVRCLAELPGWIARVRPKILGWFPGGPAATLDATLRDRRAKGGRQAWPPRGVTVTELAAGTAPAVCMAFAANVLGRLVVHSGQALLDRQQEQAEKMWTGDRWVFTRSGAGHVDALYAAAGADHLVRTMPAPKVYAKRGHYGG
jgi:hypothetical protein